MFATLTRDSPIDSRTLFLARCFIHSFYFLLARLVMIPSSQKHQHPNLKATHTHTSFDNTP
jgi:hypothetical protein